MEPISGKLKITPWVPALSGQIVHRNKGDSTILPALSSQFIRALAHCGNTFYSLLLDCGLCQVGLYAADLL